jgi:hypothetical protein
MNFELNQNDEKRRTILRIVDLLTSQNSSALKFGMGSIRKLVI